MRVVIVVPAYNEQESIAAMVGELAALRPRFAQEGHELLVCVIDDGSRDATTQRAREGGADRVVRHRRNRGLGAAVRSGLQLARQEGADVAVKIDADRQHDPADILPLLAPILADEAEVVYGNRFQRISYRMPLIRRWGNRVFTALTGWLTGWPIRDGQPGIFAVARPYLEEFHIPGDYNYTQQILVDAYHRGMRFAHVAVAFHPRRTGRSFISLKYPFVVLTQILMVLVSVRPLRVFVPVGLAFMGVAGVTFLVEVCLWLLGAEGAEKPVMHVNAVMGLALFGLQTLFFGLLAQLVVDQGRR